MPSPKLCLPAGHGRPRCCAAWGRPAIFIHRATVGALLEPLMKKPNAGRVGHLQFRRRMNVYATSAGLWLTGLIWVVFHYFIRTTDNFGFETPHPGEHLTLIAHAAFGFLAV